MIGAGVHWGDRGAPSQALADAQAQRYRGNRFSDTQGRFIEINESLSLRDALDWLEGARILLNHARQIEFSACGAENYQRAQEETKLKERGVAEGRANAQAAFYRATGRWPHDLHGLDL